MGITILKSNNKCKKCIKVLEKGMKVHIKRVYKYGNPWYEFMCLECAKKHYEQIILENISFNSPKIIVKDIKKELSKIKEALKGENI